MWLGLCLLMGFALLEYSETKQSTQERLNTKKMEDPITQFLRQQGLDNVNKINDTFSEAPKEGSENLEELARTIYGEARGDGEEGMRAVAHVIQNRINHPNKKLFGEGVRGVTRQPNQFSLWNNLKSDTAKNALKATEKDELYKSALKIAGEVLEGKSESPVGSSLYYLNPEKTREIRKDKDLPSWWKNYQKDRRTVKLGKHEFIKED